MTQSKHKKIGYIEIIKHFLLSVLLLICMIGALTGSITVREEVDWGFEEFTYEAFNSTHEISNFYARWATGTFIFLAILPFIIGYFIGWLIPIPPIIIGILFILLYIKLTITHIWKLHILEKKELKRINKTPLQLNKERFIKWSTKWFKPKDK